MKLLVTGAARFSDEQLNKLASLGFELVLQSDEMGTAQTDFASVDAAVLNGLFLYHGIEEFEKLKFIQLTSAGLDRVPLDEIKARGIKLCNARGVYSIPMAEFAVAGVLELYKKLNVMYENQKAHVWQKMRDIKEFNGSTVVIVGCGSVGTECAKRFRAFSTTVIGVDIVKPESDCYDDYFEIGRIGEALEKADIAVLTLPLTDRTSGMFDGSMFSRFKDGAFIVNITRGSVVNERELISALKSGKLGGAVLDVFENEPLSSDSELWDMENVIITPHNSFASPNNSTRLFELCRKNLENFIKEESK